MTDLRKLSDSQIFEGLERIYDDACAAYEEGEIAEYKRLMDLYTATLEEAKRRGLVGTAP